MNPTPNRNPKFRGYFKVSKSPFGAFEATEFYFMASGVMIVTGSIKLPSGDQNLIELNVELVHGKSNGDFQVTDGNGRPWAISLHFDNGGGGGNDFYSADSGIYEMAYIETAAHLTGKFNFVSIRDEINNEFEGEFNISQG